MNVSIKHILKCLSIFVFCLIVSNTLHAQEMSAEQVKQARVEIKNLQKNKQYKDADTLIKTMLIKMPSNPLFYLDLALNYYYLDQPLQAEKALEYLMHNENMAKAPEQVKNNVSVFYKKIKLAADEYRANQQNNSKLTYSVTIDGEFNDNVNQYPYSNEGQSLIEQVISDLGSVQLDASVVGYYPESKHSVGGSTRIALNYYSKNIKIKDNQISLNHFLSTTADILREQDQELESSLLFTYKLQPKIKNTHKESWLNSHQYPISYLYINQNESTLNEMQFNPSMTLFKNHSLGYRFTFTQRQYQVNTPTIDSQQANEYYYALSDVEDEFVSHSIYHQFVKQFTFKFKPTILNKLTISSASQSSDYSRFENEVSVKIKPYKGLSVSQMYRYRFTDYNGDRETENEHTLKSTISYLVIKKLTLDAQYQFRLRDSNDAQYQYNQSKYLVSLKWKS